MPKPIKLAAYGPWRLITKAEAFRLPPRYVLSVVHGDGDDWGAIAGPRLVNILEYFKSTKPLPADLLVDDVWIDERGWPVTGDE